MAGDHPPGKIDDVALYTHLRGRIEHEDSLIVSRLTWLMASQSFLFTAYAIVINGLPSAQSQHARLIRLIAAVGILSSALIFVGIVAAIRGIAWLRDQLRTRIPDEAALGLPPLHAPRPIVLAGMLAPVALPPAFIAVWLYLLATAG
jgi:hypothetical protein